MNCIFSNGAGTHREFGYQKTLHGRILFSPFACLVDCCLRTSTAQIHGRRGSHFLLRKESRVKQELPSFEEIPFDGAINDYRANGYGKCAILK